MTPPLTPKEARAKAMDFENSPFMSPSAVQLNAALAATLRAYADQAERLKEMEAVVGEYFRQNDEHARAMTAAIDAYHTDGFEGETKKAREASAKMDAAESRLRSLMEEGE